MNINKYSCYFVPLITGYLIILSYYPKLFKFFGDDYCQLLMILSIFYVYYKVPSVGWLLGVLFLLTYRSYHETQFIKEAFTIHKNTLPPGKSTIDVQHDIDKELTKEEESVIQTIEKKYADDIDFLLEDDIEKINQYRCVTNGEGVGLPEPVKKYDLSKTIDFDF